jgi:hypothetical protein
MLTATATTDKRLTADRPRELEVKRPIVFRLRYEYCEPAR